MDTMLRVSKEYRNQVKYAVLLPFFFFFFIFVYDPFSFREVMDVGGKSWTFHLLMLCCIMVGVLSLTRLVFSVLYKYVPFKWWHYILWCLGEVLVSAFFFALYISLFYLKAEGMPYFTALSYSFKILFLTLVYPYIIAIATRIIINKSLDLENTAKEPEETLIKFRDEHKRLKLTIDPSAVLFIEADENYIKINYLDNDKTRVYQLRNSMKSFEEDAARHGFVRCHRSYYVNPRHVRLLSRGKDGVIYTEFIREGVGRIPVSKRYYQNLADML